MSRYNDFLVNFDKALVDNGDGTFSLRTAPGSGTVTGNLIITGDLTVQGNFSFGDISTDVLTATGTVLLQNDVNLVFGTTNAAGTATLFQYDTAQTVDSVMIGLDETSRSLHICDYGDVSFNFANSAQTHPTLFLHSNAQSTSQFATFSQTGTNLEIKNTGAAGSTTVFTGGSTGIALQSVADQNILVGGGGFLALRSTATAFRENNGIECFGSTAKGFYTNGSRMQSTQGADVASANDLTLGAGNAFEITGTTQINAITTTNWQNGAIVTLFFTSTPTVKHNTTGGANTAVIIMKLGVDFVATAGSNLTLRYSEIGGTNAWRQI